MSDDKNGSSQAAPDWLAASETVDRNGSSQSKADVQQPSQAAGEAPGRCSNCGKEHKAGDDYIAGGSCADEEFFCSTACMEQHEELGCPHEHHHGYRHPAESARLIACEAALRSLASYVGAGGYNADVVDAAVFEEKIRWGIDHHAARPPAPPEGARVAGINLPEEGLGDDIPCSKCGSALDTGLECTECGHDMQPEVYPVGVSAVFLVCTGEVYEGEETYTRHEGKPPPLCDFETLYTAAPPEGARVPADVIFYLKGAYDYLKSTSPAGVAEEAFRLPPSPTRAQELLLHALEGDANGEQGRPAQQDRGNRPADHRPVIRGGWKMVPLEPTAEMKIAGDNAGWWCADKYRAMLAASPEAAEAGGWISVEKRMPDAGQEVLVWVAKPAFDPRPFIALDRWDEQREDPLGMGGPTIATGLAWDTYDFEQISHWQPKPSAPPAAASPAPADDGAEQKGAM